MMKEIMCTVPRLLPGRYRFGCLCLAIGLSSFAAPVIHTPPVADTVFVGSDVTFSVGATGSGTLSYQWLRDGVSVSGATDSALTFTAMAGDDGAIFSVAVSDSTGTTSSDEAELIIEFGMPGAAHTNQVIAITSMWRYDVSKTDLGTAWRETGYPDGSWATGGGLLYVESSDLPAPKTTLLPLVSRELPLTCYFRTSFTNDFTDAYSVELVANTVVDDGIVVYLNGSEVRRNHMDEGTVSYSTLAESVNNAVYEGPFSLDAATLVDGENIIAAEVHQTSTNSSDIVMGLMLDVIWTERIADADNPVVDNLSPAAGATVSKLEEITVTFNEGVRGVDASDLLMNGIAATNVVVIDTSTYQFAFADPAEGTVLMSWATGHGIVDRSVAEHGFSGADFSYFFEPPSRYAQLEFESVRQSTDASDAFTAEKALDGAAGTYSLTQDLPGSWWMAELGRPYELQRIELVNRAIPDDAAMEGLTLSVMNMDDQVVFEAVLSNPGPGAVTAVNLPAGTVGRTVRIGLSGSEVNGAGTYVVSLAEVRVVGVIQIPYMPEPFVAEETDVELTGFSVSQTTDYNTSLTADMAVDGDAGTFSHTDSTTPNNYWIADLGSEQPVAQIELVDRGGNYYSRMDNLVVRVLDGSMNPVASVVVVSPGSGGTYVFITPENTEGHYVKIGLENGETNGRGDYAVQLAEVRVYSEVVNATELPPTENLATDKRSYMVRVNDSQPLPEVINDGDMSTEATITEADCYWEVDLGEPYALYGVRAVGATGIGDRLTNTVCRLYDENHDSVFDTFVTGEDPVFDVDLRGPRFARYVRIGLEEKRYSSGLDGSREWKIGFKEVEVFGRPVSAVGIDSYSVSDTTISSGEEVSLTWSVEDVHRVAIHPSIGSVGSHTDTNGVGLLTYAVDESTEFILVATNHAGLFTRAVGVEIDGETLPVVISEIVADNKYSLEDGYGDAPDWIELRNTGNSTVDLTGWGLSDNPEKPMKFTFPSVNIAPHSTLIVFASKEETPIDPAGMLHADFSLDKDGETVVLTAADELTTLDSVTYPELDTDLAYGRALDGGWIIMEPTGGAVNAGEIYNGWLHSLDWSHARGFYETNFTLTVTSEDPAATILYSRDGTEPSIPYTAGLPIAGTSVVRIQSVWPGYKSARIQTKSFIFLDDIIANENMDTDITQDTNYVDRIKPGLHALPTLSLVVSTTGDVEDAIEYAEQACSLEILWPDGQDPIQEDCGVSRFGGSYSYFAKKGLSLSFRREYGKGKLEAPLFNGFDRGVLARKSFDKLHLRGGNHDMKDRGFFMSDRFIQDSYLDMGSLNPHGRYVHVYLNGEYWGNYNCKEVLNESFLADYLGGSSEDYVSVKGNANAGAKFVIGFGDPPHPEPWERVRSLRDTYEAVSPYLDVSHYIDFMLLWGYGNSESEFRACGPKEAGSGHKFWINDPDGFLRYETGDRISSKNGPGLIWTALLSEDHPDFKMWVADRIYKHFFNAGAMTPAACDARLTVRMNEIRESYLAESARWGYLTPEEWEAKAAAIQSDMFPYRGDEVVSFARDKGYFPLFDPPNFNLYGGNVAEGFVPVLTSSDGTIYYTLDGTDPRLPGGAINSAAISWTAGAVTVTEDMTITTRVRASDGTWSALAEPRFLLGSRQSPVTGDLLVTEVHYNPAGSDEYEFIEIWNSGTNLVDLSGVNISNAVRYIFPEYTTLNPGEHMVVVEDALAFADRYQNASSPWYWNGVSVSGEWVGGLSDGGETILLVASNGVLISECKYRSDGDWPGRPDGGGSSLQILFPSLVPKTLAEQQAYLADGRNWIASSLYHGSPGRFESAGNGVVINEVLAHTDVDVDWIELYNPNSSLVDLSGLGLTDDMDWPNRYVFPNGTSIDGNGYLTISASTLGYGFSELGAEAALLELSGTQIVRIIDRVDFPAVEREEPFGRYERSDGEIDFTELSEITPNAANALPRVGPVVISEIMFAPDVGYAEYVELINISGAAVALYDTAIPTNTWEFSGAGDFSFPEGTILQADEMAILCSTNPAAFRAQYGIDAETKIFGPWTGGLANEGEKLQLLYPGDPEFDGFVPMYRVDHVSYRTNSVWPVANSGGVSLERRLLDSYGNDPISWRASPFSGSPGFVMGDSYPMGTVVSVGSSIFPMVSFSAIEGESYQVRYTDSLTDPDWKLLRNLPTVTTNWIEVVDPSTTSSTRYYRILWDY